MAALRSPELKPPFHSLRHRPQPDGSLVISPLRAEDAGTYSCGTRPGRDSLKIQLLITGLCPPPTVGSQGPRGGRDWLRGPEPGTPGPRHGGRGPWTQVAGVEVLLLVALIPPRSHPGLMADPSSPAPAHSFLLLASRQGVT